MVTSSVTEQGDKNTDESAWLSQTAFATDSQLLIFMSAIEMYILSCLYVLPVLVFQEQDREYTEESLDEC